MAAVIAPADWLEFIRDEYLDSFIKDGGASVKFVVPIDAAIRSAIDSGVAESAGNSGYITVRVSAADTRIHMIDQLFFRIAEQIPWRRLSESVVLRLAAEHGFLVPPEDGDDALIERMATSNSINPELLGMEVRRWIGEAVMQQKVLAKEFRTAMTHLCLAELSGGPDGETRTEVITDWLSGRNKAVSAVKPYQIFSKITRHNARHLLVSLLHWIRYARFSGLVIILDLERLATPRNPRDGSLFYTKAQLLDAYEVFRQFIDATDRMKSCLVLAVPSHEFLDPDPRGRGMAAYPALWFRVNDEIHDQRLANPMAALVRLSENGRAA
jgi:hypothetical protein